jgi:hypothetical protein
MITMLFRDNQLGLNSVMNIYKKTISRIKIMNIKIILQIIPKISKLDKIVFCALGVKDN